MFDNLGSRLSTAFKKLSGKGVISEADVNAAMREVRIALLEADVSIPVAKDFIAKVTEKAVGQDVIKSVSPAQMIIKIVNDHLVELLGSDTTGINLETSPTVIMMVGLQGSGKTTSSAKLANLLKDKNKKKPLLVSLDIYRPAAQHQIEVLGQQIAIDTLPIIEKEKPEKITKRALKEAKKNGNDVIILDTAGRLHIDETLMTELKEVKKIAEPTETILVADSLTGQDAVNVAQQFNEQIGLTGIILTRIDGDGRGGAALSMRAVTGCPIKFIGVGEKISEFEVFHPDRIASRILDMGDVVSLVEKAKEVVDEAEAEKMAEKLQKGEFTLDDLLVQFQTMKKMGGMGSLLKMIPGMGNLGASQDKMQKVENAIVRQEAIIFSMTKKERQNAKLINGSRKKRIAAGSGSSVQEVNRVLKQHRQMQGMMKKLSKMGKKGMKGIDPRQLMDGIV